MRKKFLSGITTGILAVSMAATGISVYAAEPAQEEQTASYAPVETVTYDGVTFGRATASYNVTSTSTDWTTGETTEVTTVYEGMPLFDGEADHIDTYLDLLLSEMGKEGIIHAASSGTVTGTYEGGTYVVPVSTGSSADVGNDGGTQWPNQLGVAQSWNKELTYEMGSQYGQEIRAEKATNSISGSASIGAHVAQIDPHINPLAGRYDEGYGEDAYMISELVNEWGQGMRGEESDIYYQAIAKTKHWAEYGSEFFRMQGSYNVSARTFYEYYAEAANRPFSQGALLGYMSSYGRINGIPSTSAFTQKYAQSLVPYGLVNGCDFMSEYGYTATASYMSGANWSNGYDLFYSSGMYDRNALMTLAGHKQGGNAMSANYIPDAGLAYDQYEILLADVDNAVLGITLDDVTEIVRPMLLSALRTGAMDERDENGQPKYYPYIVETDDTKSAEYHQNAEIQDVELQAAEESVVLLKNENDALPITKGTTIDVLGTFGDIYQYGLYSTALTEIETDETLPTYSQQYAAGLTLAEALGAEDAYSEALAAVYEADENVTYDAARKVVTIQIGGQYLTADADGNITLTDEAAEGSYFEMEDWGQDAYSFYSPVAGAWLDGNLVNPSNAVPMGVNALELTATYEANFKPISHGQVIDSNFPDFFEIKNIDGQTYLKIGSKYNVTDFGADYTVPDLMGWYLKNDNGSLVIDATLSDDPENPTTYESTASAVEDAGMGAEYEMVITEQDIAIDASADTAVIVVGAVYNGISGEGVDRLYYSLGDGMVSQAKKYAEAYKAAGKNVVLVIKADYPVEADVFQDDSNIDAIVFAPMGGQYEGYALASILYGDVNPSGKTVSTWYVNQDQLPAIDEYALPDAATVTVNGSSFGNPMFLALGLPEDQALAGYTNPTLDDIAVTVDMTSEDLQDNRLTYEYFTGDVTYPFGYGLSYTSYEYDGITVNDPSAEDVFTVDTTVTNTGDTAGSEAVEVYISKVDSAYGDAAPIKKLVGFEKVSLEAGESKTVSIEIDPADFAIWDVNGEKYIVEDGDYVISVSDSSALTSENTFSTTITLAGETVSEAGEGELNVWEHAFDTNSLKFVEYSKGKTIEAAQDSEVRDDTFAVMSKEAGAYAAIPNVNLDGVTSIAVMAAAINDGNIVEIRLDAPDGDVLATLNYDATEPVTMVRDEANEELAGSYTELGYVSVTADVQAEGNHDIYIVFQTADSRIATIEFVK